MNVLYAKYNRERRPRFRTETRIVEEAGVRTVEKRPLGAAAREHVSAMYESQVRISARSEALRFPAVTRRGDALVFGFVEGESLESVLIQRARAGDDAGFFALLGRYRDLLQDLSSEGPPLPMVAEFEEVFGVTSGWSGSRVLDPGNVDLIFQNLLVDSGNRLWLIDCEWCFDFPVPLGFLFHRSLHLLGEKFGAYLTGTLEPPALLSFFQIPQSDCEIFRNMELSLGVFVFGVDERPNALFASYRKPVVRPVDLLERVHILEERAQVSRGEASPIGVGTSAAEAELLRSELDIANARLLESEGERGELLEKAERLHWILASNGWRLLEKLYAVVGRVLPPESSCRRLLKRVLRNLA